MYIYFIRHGQDEEGFRGGWSDKSLSKNGNNEVELLSKHLAMNADRFLFDTIISSDLNRTRETSEIISNELSSAWREFNNGIIAGMENEEANKLFPGLCFNKLGFDEKYPNGETPRAFYNRIKVAFENIVSIVRESKKSIMIVAHAGVINIIYYIVHNFEWTNTSPVIKCSTSSLHEIFVDEEKMEITLENYIDHLLNEIV